MERKIGIIVPFQIKKQYQMDRVAKKSLLFAKSILKKYNALFMYGFDDAAMVLLEKISGDSKQETSIQRQIAFTVNLMLYHQNKNRLAKSIIEGNTAFQQSITHHVLVNLNRLLSVDRRVYKELSQITKNNVKIQDAYEKIQKFDNYEKKIVLKQRNQEMVKSTKWSRSMYQWMQTIWKQTQLKLSHQSLQESHIRKQFKTSLNKLLELKSLKSDVEKHEFLHVMKHGTLREKRDAMDILKVAVGEVVNSNKKKTPIWNQVEEKENTNIWNAYTKTYRNSQHAILETRRLTTVKMQEERHLINVQNKKREQEISELRSKLVLEEEQRVMQGKILKELNSHFVKQSELVVGLQKNQEVWKQKSLPKVVGEHMERKLKSEIKLDKMRYGLE